MNVNSATRLLLSVTFIFIASIGCNQKTEESEKIEKDAPIQEVAPRESEEERPVLSNEKELVSEKNTLEDELNDDPQPVSIDLPGIIIGKGVLMRSSYSTQSASKGTFKQGESVWVIEELEPNNNNEGITKTYVKLYDEYGQHAETLNPGRAVKIIAREGSKYKVSFMSTKRQKLTAKIDRSEIDIISGDKWYRVRRDNGETGWVFSKFLEFDIYGH
jgi:hypothetical protein